MEIRQGGKYAEIHPHQKRDKLIQLKDRNAKMESQFKTQNKKELYGVKLHNLPTKK